ncbi:MAG: CAP domain-containing protein [Thermoanaerobaculaceae bacterium]
MDRARGAGGEVEHEGTRRWVVLIAVILACVPALAGEPEETGWDAGPGAVAYGQPGTLGGVAATWGEAARGVLPGLVLDPGLARAAEACARWLGEHAAAELPPGLVELSLRWAGCSDPTAVSLLLLTSESSPDELWERLRELRERPGFRQTHWGFGAAESRRERFRTAWVALLSERKVALEPVPRAVEPGQSLGLVGRWTGDALAGPRLVVLGPGEATRELAARVEGGVVTMTTGALREVGEHTLELLADGTYGPEVLALLVVRVGGQPSTSWSSPVVSRDVPITAFEAERRLLELANEERRRLNLAPLIADATLQAVARAHSADMADGGFFGHRSPRRGDFGERFRASGWRALRAAENLSKSESILEAHAGLMASPAHRSNLLSPYFTHVGIGVATRKGDLGRTEFVVTQVFGLPMPGTTPVPGD